VADTETIQVPFTSQVLTQGATQAAAGAAVAALVKPEALPTFPRAITAVDGYMSRVPWWLLVGVSVGATWWLCKRGIKLPTITSST
jgi:hypothetical protein